MASCVNDRSGPESKEAIEFCLNCKKICCSSGLCPAFYEKFVLANTDSKRIRKGKEYEWNGESHNLKEWSLKLDIPLPVLYRRRHKGLHGDKLFAPYRYGVRSRGINT